MKPTYRCEFQRISVQGREYRLIAHMLEHHPKASAGEVICTSAILSIDLERGICVTKNSIYLFEGWRHG